MNYALNDEKMFADVTDGIAIVINSETGIYFGMNGAGTLIYENLVDKNVSVENLLAALKAVAGAPADIEARLKDFIQKMLDNELIVEAAANDGGTAEINEDVFKEDEFVFDVQAYDDAQELLLADPIHEVKEETGWTPEKDSIGYTKEETKEREKKLEK